MARPRIGLVSFNVSHGLVYQRLHLPLRHLKHKYDFVPIDLAELRHSDAFYMDAVIMCQPWTTGYLKLIERFLLHYRIPVISDVDDLVNQLPTDHPDYESFTSNCLTQVIQSSTHMVYSTEYMKQKLIHLNHNAKVIPNSIDARIYKNYEPRPKPYKNSFIVGWTGGQSHRPDQHVFLSGLQEFLRRHSDAKSYFHILCPDVLVKEFGSQIIFEPHPVEFLDYPAMAATYPFDVCLVGLTDCPFNNAKSDLKLLEMAPQKIPIIASPRSDFIQHKDLGVMKYAENDWCEQLTAAYETRKDLLPAMGRKAYDYVLANRTSDKVAPLWDEVIETCLNK